MALIKCPKCGKEISDKAKQCVGCGWEVESIKNSKKEKAIKLQHAIAEKRRKSFPSANILFMMVLVIVIICFMFMLWRRVDNCKTGHKHLVWMAILGRSAENVGTEAEVAISYVDSMR